MRAPYVEPYIDAHVLLSELRVAESMYLQTIRWERHLWVEAALCRARIHVIDLIAKHCPRGRVFANNERRERKLKSKICRFVWTKMTPTEKELQAFIKMFRQGEQE